jgi:hypothetical protein
VTNDPLFSRTTGLTRTGVLWILSPAVFAWRKRLQSSLGEMLIMALIGGASLAALTWGLNVRALPWWMILLGDMAAGHVLFIPFTGVVYSCEPPRYGRLLICQVMPAALFGAVGLALILAKT